VLVLRWSTLSAPRVAESDRFTIEQEAPNFWHLEARYGFMEMPDIPKLLASCAAADEAIDLADVTYYVGRTSIVPREGGQGLPAWQREPFAGMARNSARMSDYLKVPACRNRSANSNLTVQGRIGFGRRPLQGKPIQISCLPQWGTPFCF
jgi:KUP system potassium uptake protein